MTLQLRYVAHSEIGLIRKNNQDSGLRESRICWWWPTAWAARRRVILPLPWRSTRYERSKAVPTGEQMLEVLAGAIHEANDQDRGTGRS